MTLNDRLREYRTRQEAGDVPPITAAHLEVIYRHAHRLADSGAADRVLRFAEAHPLHWERSEPDDLIAAVRTLQGEPCT